MTFILFIIFKVGDGSCVKFWCDPWCERLPLKNIFLELYNIASNKDASVAELLLSSKANYHWNIRFYLTGSGLGIGVDCIIYGRYLFWI